MGRLSTIDYEKIVNSKKFDINYGGAEANVAVTLANLGVEVSSFISALPENTLGDSIIKYLRSNNVEVKHIIRNEGRLGLYFVETGFSLRNSSVIYDRKNSVIAEANSDDFDFDEILKNYDWFHISGITPAISKKAKALTLKALVSAKKLGLKVSLDLNYTKKSVYDALFTLVG